MLLNSSGSGENELWAANVLILFRLIFREIMKAKNTRFCLTWR